MSLADFLPKDADDETIAATVLAVIDYGTKGDAARIYTVLEKVIDQLCRREGTGVDSQVALRVLQDLAHFAARLPKEPGVVLVAASALIGAVGEMKKG